MSQRISKYHESGTGAISYRVLIPTGTHQRVISVALSLDATPTTSEDYTIDLEANASDTCDLRLYTVDPGATSTSDILWQPDADLILEGGDYLRMTYPNSDNNDYGCQVTLEMRWP